MDEITFSSDTGEISREDMDVTSKIAEEYFEMEHDLEQIPATNENRDWIYNKIPECLDIIRNGEEIIGFTFMSRSLKKPRLSRRGTP
jgi:hypothetical protein